MIVFEITEDGTSASDGASGWPTSRAGASIAAPSRPTATSWSARSGLRGLQTRARTADDYAHGLAELLGSAWDAELEPYRHAGDGAPVTLLHQVV